VTVFWTVVALLLLGALLILLPPLWRPRPSHPSPQAAETNLSVYRDQLRENHEAATEGLLAPDALNHAQEDIRRRALEDTQPERVVARLAPARRTAWALAVLLPLASVLTYLGLGEPNAIGGSHMSARSATEPADGRHSTSAQQIEEMVANLARRLQAQPEDADGWAMLGRSYTALGRYPDAVIAFRRAVALVPGDATLLSDFADVLGMAQGKRLAGEPAQMVQSALDIDPNNVKALALAGSVAFEARDYANARGYWERLVAVVPADSEIARSVRGSILEAQHLESGGSTDVARAAPTEPAPRADAETAAVPMSAESIEGRVEVAPTLLGQVAPGDTLFVFARAVNGPRMPLAIFKRPVGAWPQAFVLDDSLAMAPGLRLSAFDQVSLGARISRSGDALPRSGDLVGQLGPVGPGARGLVIVVDRVQP
jgi:cytochrome c-type biogenesis protein CcmH